MEIGLHLSALLGSLTLYAPEAALLAGACILFLGGTSRSDRHMWSVLAIVALIVAIALTPFNKSIVLAHNTIYSTPSIFDGLTELVRYVAFGGGILLVLLNWNDVPHRQAADHHACLLLISAGVSITASANDLITLFLALELISIPTYILLYLPRHDEASQEAAMKYFMLSVFSSALLLFGFSYLYGLVGTTNIAALLHTVNGVADPRELPAIAHLALIMVVAGIGFRITAVPFHFYAPDVYQGASAGGAALLAFVPKVAGFVALIRVLGFVMPADISPRDGWLGVGLSDQVPILFWFLAVITMFLGNVLALWQENLKRLLAYSSVAHAGYMLIALSVAPYLTGDSGPNAIEALLYYLVAYGAMTIGAFGVISYLDTKERPVQTVDDLAGLSRSHPGIALLMVVFLFSLIGVPLTAGFTGKLLIFFGAMAVPTAPEHAWLFRVLALLGAINAAIGAWYYLRIIAAMYLRGTLRPIPARASLSGLATLWLCALLTVGLSVPPGVNWVRIATRHAVHPAIVRDASMDALPPGDAKGQFGRR